MFGETMQTVVSSLSLYSADAAVNDDNITRVKTKHKS